MDKSSRPASSRAPNTAEDVRLSRLTPSSSRQFLHPGPQTPGASNARGGEYFPTLTPSISTRSIRTDGGDGVHVRPRAASRVPSIRLRRNSNASIISTATVQEAIDDAATNNRQSRPRSTSQSGTATADRRPQTMGLPRLTEEGIRPTMEEIEQGAGSRLSPTPSVPESTGRPAPSSIEIASTNSPPRKRGLSRRFWPSGASEGSRLSAEETARLAHADEYDQELVDWLDIVDPEIQTLSTLTNIQNSLFIPDLGNLINRRPTYTLTERDRAEIIPELAQQHQPLVPPTEPTASDETDVLQPRIRRSDTITSRLTESHYAALPHGVSLDDWTPEEKAQLDDHVRHMLHSRRSKFKRMMKGFGQYVRRPLGLFVTVYATLITLFGLAWVLFLIGWIYVGDSEKQRYTIFVIDSVLVALFAIMGDGLAPFRAVDTYHLIFVVKYSRMMEKARRKQGLEASESDADAVAVAEGPQQQLQKESESTMAVAQDPAGAVNTTESAIASAAAAVGDVSKDPSTDIEEAVDGKLYYPLTPKQQKRFLHHRDKLAKSHSFYKPEETFTHHVFPLSYLIAVVVLLDCHSCLQISLGATTWGIDYHTRPFAITTVILCVSITCNITAGLVITMGDRKTRKKDVIKLMDRQELTSDAIKAVQKQRDRE